MKTILAAFFIFFSTSLCADTIQLGPLSEAEGKLLWYRTLMIEGSFSELKNLIKEIEVTPEMQEELDYLFFSIEYNLGYPVEVDEVGYPLLK